MQIVSVRMRESKYGLALVIQTAATAGNYVLGFRIDPQERLHEVYKEILSLHSVYSEKPIFGVNFDRSAKVGINNCCRVARIQSFNYFSLPQFAALSIYRSLYAPHDAHNDIGMCSQEKENNLLRIDDIAEIDATTSSEINSKFTMYLREGDSEKRREPFYCKDLGKMLFQHDCVECEWIFMGFVRKSYFW